MKFSIAAANPYLLSQEIMSRIIPGCFLVAQELFHTPSVHFDIMDIKIFWPPFEIT